MFKRNTAGQHLGFLLLSVSGGTVLGASVTVYRTIDGGAQGLATGVVSEAGNGQYVLVLSADDLNGSDVSFLFVAPGAVPCEKTVVTTAANPDDGVYFGLSSLTNIGSGVMNSVLLTVDAQARLVDSTGAPVTQVTFGQAIAALFVDTLGDRSGVQSRQITAVVPGISNCSVTAARVSTSVIEMRIVLPAAQ